MFQTRRLPGLLLLGIVPAYAISPPPHRPPLLREATMRVKVRLIEARNGTVSNIGTLCELTGKIPVYADDGRSASAHARDIPGCSMTRDGKKLGVSVLGAKAISKARVRYATASVGVVPPDAVPLCPHLCGPQPLADSSAEVRASGRPRSMAFSLKPNPVSLLNARPTLWLEADVEVLD